MKAAASAVFACGLLFSALSYGQPARSPNSIDIREGLLSVSLSDAPLGNVMAEIALKAGFEADVRGDIAARKVSTEFGDVELAKGIRRLLALAGQTNYIIHLDSGGAIKKLTVQSAGVSGRPAARPRPVVPRSPVRPPTPRPPPALQAPQTGTPVPPFDMGESESGEAPPFEVEGAEQVEPPPFERR